MEWQSYQFLYFFFEVRLAQNYNFFSVAQQPLVGQGHLIVEVSRSHSDTPHSLGLPWTIDQPDAETST
jgi:hypothetical protein